MNNINTLALPRASTDAWPILALERYGGCGLPRKAVGSVVKSSFSRNPYSRVFFNEAIEEVVQH